MVIKKGCERWRPMIFSGSNKGITHIGMILMGLEEFRANVDFGGKEPIIKTQTRRWSERVPVPQLYQRYEIGQLYAVQPKRTRSGLEGVKIKLTRKWIDLDPKSKEVRVQYYPLGYLSRIVEVRTIPISTTDALAEGGYTPEEFEDAFLGLNPKWPGTDRVGLEFEVVKIGWGEEGRWEDVEVAVMK
jgi:hypothetical protein